MKNRFKRAIIIASIMTMVVGSIPTNAASAAYFYSKSESYTKVLWTFPKTYTQTFKRSAATYTANHSHYLRARVKKWGNVIGDTNRRYSKVAQTVRTAYFMSGDTNAPYLGVTTDAFYGSN